MAIHQHATIGDTIYFWFGSNDTSGSGNDGASAAADVRLAGGAAGDAPILSPSPTLLTHANYPAGCYEVAVAATVGNGFAAASTYAIFCTLLVDSQNPTGFIGSFTLTPLATAAAVATIDDFLDTEIAAILADTNELQTDWADGGRLDLILDARASQSSVDTVDNFLDTEIADIYAAVVTDAAGTNIAADIIAMKVDTAAILADTGTDGVVVKAAGLATDAVAEIADGIWDEIITAGQHNIKNSAARILRQASGGTNVTLHSGIAASGTASTIVLDNAASATNDVYNRNLIALVGGTGTGQTRRIVDYIGASRTVYVDVNWVVNPDATSQFEVVAAPTSIFADEGVAQAGGSDYIDLATTASTTDDIYNNSLITITGGTGSGQTEVITDYTGATRRASIAAETWGTQPDSTSVYAVIPAGNVAPDTGSVLPAPTASEVADAVWDELKASHTIADSFGDYLDDEITSRSIAGDAMNLADNAITAAKYDESTAFPLASADTGATAVARTGADADTLETLSDQLDVAQADLDNPNQYKADVSALALQTSVDDLEGRLTATRAGYLDNLSAGAVALEATVQSILTDTAEIGLAGAGLIAIPWNATWDIEVESEANDALVANNLDHIALTATGIPAIPAGTYLDQMMDDGTAVYDRTTDSLQAIRDRGDAAWDTADVSALALQASVDDLEGRLTATRAGYLDNLSGGAVALQSSVDDLEGRLTATRAGYLDNLSAGAVATAASIAALNDLSAAEVNIEVDTALADANLDHLAGTATGIPAIPAGTYIDQMMDDGTAVFDRTTDSLQAIRDNMTGTDTAAIADAVWDEVINVGHAVANSAAVDLVAVLEDTGTTLDDLVDDLESRLSATRAGYLDNLSAGAVALQASIDDLEGRLTAARAGYLDNLSAGAVALQASVDDLEGRLTAVRAGYLDNLSAGAAALEATAQSILTDTGTTIPAQIIGLNNLSAAQVNAEVVDALNVDTYAEPGQGAPAATASLAAKIGYLYKAWRNKKTQTAVTRSLYNDAGDTVDQKATDSDDGVTFTKGKIGTGP